jgi:hypothetical protein
MTAVDATPMRRCCVGHDDWSTLTEHLLVDFSDLSDDQVVAQLLRARSAVQSFGLSIEEELHMGEVLARHQLMLLTGEIPDAARLDPEVHVRSGMR